VGYEFAKFARMRTLNLKKMTLENELCSKWENINIDNDLKMIEKKLAESTKRTNAMMDTTRNKFLDLRENPLSNLPIFLLPNQEQTGLSHENKQEKEDKREQSKKEFFLFRRQSSSIFSSNTSKAGSTAKSLKAVKSGKASTSPKSSSSQSNHQTPIKQLIPNSSTKKRNINSVLNEIKSGTPIQSAIDETESAFSTPKSKRRLIMNDHSLANCSPSRTILHYFSPKPPTS